MQNCSNYKFNNDFELIMKKPYISSSFQFARYIIIFTVFFMNCGLNLLGQNQQNENIQSPTFYLMDDINGKSIDNKAIDEKEPMFGFGFGMEWMYNLLKVSNDTLKINDYAKGIGISMYLHLKLNVLSSISKKLKLNIDFGYSMFRPTLNQISTSTDSGEEIKTDNEYNYDFKSYILRPSLEYDFDFITGSIGLTSNFVNNATTRSSTELSRTNNGVTDKLRFSGKETKMENVYSSNYSLSFGVTHKIKLANVIHYYPYLAYDLPLTKFGDSKTYGGSNGLSNIRIGVSMFYSK